MNVASALRFIGCCAGERRVFLQAFLSAGCSVVIMWALLVQMDTIEVVPLSVILLGPLNDLIVQGQCIVQEPVSDLRPYSHVSELSRLCFSVIRKPVMLLV